MVSAIYYLCRCVDNRTMNKTIVATGLLIGYYLYLNKPIHDKDVESNARLFELVEKSYATDSEYTVRETINRKLEKLKGDFKIIGWGIKKVDEQTFLASYTYKRNSKILGWFFDVKSRGRIIRDVSLDQKLMKKYNVVFNTVFTVANNAQMRDLIKKSFEMSGLQYKDSLFGDIVPSQDGCNNLPPSELEIFRNLRIKLTEHNERILMPEQE